MDVFADALVPAMSIVRAGEEVKLGKLFDIAILFGAISALEGNAGFTEVPLTTLRDLYADKLKNV